MNAGKLTVAMKWELARLLNPANRVTRVYLAATSDGAAAAQMAEFYRALNAERGW